MNEQNDLTRFTPNAGWLPFSLSEYSRSRAAPNLRVLLGMISRQRKSVIASALIVIAISALACLLLENRYSATGMLLVENREAQLAGVEDAMRDGGSINNRIDTETELLSSPSVLIAAIKNLELWKDQEFALKPPLLERLLMLVKASARTDEFTPASFGSLSESDKSALAEKLSRSIKIARRGFTSIIEVTATSKSPEKAAKIANVMLSSFLDVQVESSIAAAQRAADFLEVRANEIAGSIANVDERLTTFIDDFADRIEDPADRAELQKLRGELKRASNQEGTIQKQIEKFEAFRRGGNPSDFIGLDGSPELKGLLQERDQVLKQIDTLSKTPDLRAQLRDIDSRLQAVTDRDIETLRGQLGSVQENRERLRQQLQGIVGKQSLPADVSVALFRLQQEAEINNKMYEAYAGRLAEVRQKIGFALPNSRIVSAAIEPNRPSFPPRLAIMAIGILAAAGIGLAVGYAREHYIGGFSSIEQFEAVTGTQVASSVPTQKNAESAFATMPLSGFSESIRRLRVAYEQSMDHSKSSVILITSTAPAEGKSVIALSLARSFASVGKRTLLIDADLRHPSIARMLGVEAGTGLSDYLVDESGTMELIPLSDKDSRLDLILGGSPMRLVSDVLVGSSKFIQTIRVLQEVYEVILIDCAPIGPVVDARIVSKLADEILFVVKFGVTPQRAVLSGLKEMLIDRRPDTLKVALNMRSNGAGAYYGSEQYRDYYQSSA